MRAALCLALLMGCVEPPDLLSEDEFLALTAADDVPDVSDAEDVLDAFEVLDVPDAPDIAEVADDGEVVDPCGGGCDDGNPCTTDSCGRSGCVNEAHGQSCDDDDPCTVGDVCAMGACASGDGVLDCSDGNECTSDSCADGKGCEYVDLDKSCVDGDPCTTAEWCIDGACVTEPLVCDDGSECTDDWCDPENGGCQKAPVQNGTTCDDGDPCTLDGTCFSGNCDPAAAFTCGAPVCEGNLPQCLDCILSKECAPDDEECPKPCMTWTFEDAEVVGGAWATHEEKNGDSNYGAGGLLLSAWDNQAISLATRFVLPADFRIEVSGSVSWEDDVSGDVVKGVLGVTGCDDPTSAAEKVMVGGQWKTANEVWYHFDTNSLGVESGQTKSFHVRFTRLGTMLTVERFDGQQWQKQEPTYVVPADIQVWFQASHWSNTAAGSGTMVIDFLKYCTL